jgi:hypothetical protein
MSGWCDANHWDVVHVWEGLVNGVAAFHVKEPIYQATGKIPLNHPGKPQASRNQESQENEETQTLYF